MDVWTWDGFYFGMIINDFLYEYISHKNIGKLYDSEIYSPEGKYLGEIMDGDRLIVCSQKKNKTVPPFLMVNRNSSFTQKFKQAKRFDLAGYESFPEVATFK